MQILVCISNVPDTTTRIRFSNDSTSVNLEGVQWIINPWDELALTRAMELKEDASNPVSRVTVLTVGRAVAEPTLRKALAIGADDAIRVDADAADSYSVAQQVASVLKTGGFDMILCGIESSDHNGSSVGGMVAEMLEIPSVSAVSSVNFENGEPVLTREIDGGKEQVTVQVPFVAVVQKGIAKEPRIAAMRGIMMARQKPLKVVPAVPSETMSQYTGYYHPEPKAPCRMLGADQVKELVNLLQNEAKVI